LRLLADVADVKTFKETFAENRDIHNDTARKIFRIPVGQPVPKDLRAKAKTVNFSIIYGISSFGLAAQLNVSRTEAQGIIDSYMAELPEVRDYFDKTKKFAMDNGFVYTPWGRRIELPEVRNPRLRAYALRAAINAPIQGFEADIMRKAMVDINEQLAVSKEQTKIKDNKAASDASTTFANCSLLTANCAAMPRMIMQVHDEIVFECDAARADEFAAQIKKIMESAADLSVPLLAETAIGLAWEK